VLTQDDFYDLIDSMVAVMNVPEGMVVMYQGDDAPAGWSEFSNGEDQLPAISPGVFIYIIKDAVS